MTRFPLDSDKRVLILAVLCFLGTGTGIGVFFGGQALLDLAEPPNHAFMSEGGSRASLTAFFTKMMDTQDSDAAASREDDSGSRQSDPEKLAFLKDSVSPAAAVQPDAAAGAQSSAAPKAAASAAKPSGAAAPQAIGGQLGEIASAGASSSKGGGEVNTGNMLVLAAGTVAAPACEPAAEGGKIKATMHNVANMVHTADQSASATGAKSAIDDAWDRRLEAVSAQETGALAGMDVIKKSVVADLKMNDPKTLAAPDTGALHADSKASGKDPLNAQLLKALTSGTDASSGLANSVLSGISSSLSKAVASSSTKGLAGTSGVSGSNITSNEVLTSVSTQSNSAATVTTAGGSSESYIQDLENDGDDDSSDDDDSDVW
jgi:hypothetical protein